MTKKILISPGFGAGWSTWTSGDEAKFGLTYQPLIDFLERGGKITSKDENCPILKQFMDDFRAKFGPKAHFYLGGAKDLVVREVDGPFFVDEYDGSESIVTGFDLYLNPDNL